MGIETTVAGIRLEHPIMNGAGWGCKTIEEVETLARTPVSAIVVGSITMNLSPGNEGNVYWSHPEGLYSLNSLGLPNQGWPYYGENLQMMRRIAHDAGKPLIVSIACFSPQEYAALAGFVANENVDVIELNLGCPNVWGEGQQKPIASYQPELVETILRLVRKEVLGRGYPVRIAAKISPLPPSILHEVADAITASGFVSVVTATNTMPNAFTWDENKPATTPAGGFAGLAGPALKPISMGVVKQLCNLLPDGIDIIAVGGIQSGQDVRDYLALGPKVKAVQITTAHANRGPRVFDEVLSQYVNAVS